MHLVLFDVDGTLVDSQHMIVAAMNRAFADVGLAPPPRAETLSVVGLSLDEAMTTLLGASAEPAAVRALAEAYKSAYFDLRRAGDTAEPLFPGALAVLDDLAARDDVLLGLATGKSHRGIRAVLDLHDLHGRFVTVQCADDHPSKPHPAMILAALAETGIEPEHAAIVGDTEFDVKMGRSAGILAIGVAWGYHPADRLHRAGAATVLDDFAGLVPALSGRFGW